MKQIKLTDINNVQPYEKNPRINDNAVQYVANSIKDFGFQSPIIVDKNMVIIAGHTRLKAAQSLGLDKVPVIVADELTEEQANALRLADNKTAEQAEWDFELLADEIENIFDFDMQDFGFTFEDDVVEKKTTEREDLSDEVESCYQIIIECANEAEQERLYNELVDGGLTCRVLTL